MECKAPTHNPYNVSVDKKNVREKMQILKKKRCKINVQRAIVSLCILVVCIGTQQIQTAAWNSGRLDFFRAVVGALLAIIIMTNYKWKDYVEYKTIYILWTVLGGLAGIVVTPIVVSRRWEYLAAQTIIIALGIFLMGYCIIHTVINFFVKKYRPKLYKPLFIIWVIMMLWMIFSRSDYLWPEGYFCIFLCYYLTEQTKEQRINVVHGLIDGIILGFMVIQGHALLCRPYDRVRYVGNFCNPNHNCMFLCMCLAAILAKILFLIRDNSKIYIKIFYFLMGGFCYSLVCMTMSRTGYLTAGIVTVFFLVAYCRMKKKMMFFRMGMLLVTIFVAMLPVTYLAVRYIPTIHPHVLFYFQEGYSLDRVHSWDPRDSEKYVTFEQVLGNVLGRFASAKTALDNLNNQSSNTEGQDFLKVASNIGHLPRAAVLQAMQNTIDKDKVPALTDEEAANAFTVRYTIYKWYVDHLSLRGMPYDEQGFQITKEQWIQDTHNIYLDYGINFGYPVMILFTVFIWWGIGRLTKQGIQGRDVEKIACLLIALVPPIFGLLEYSWGTGMISTVAFYMAFNEMFQQ